MLEVLYYTNFLQLTAALRRKVCEHSVVTMMKTWNNEPKAFYMISEF